MILDVSLCTINIKSNIMKALYFIALSLLIVSCKNQGKMDLEAAKKATVDSMEVAMEKQRVIDPCRWK
jgi:uncharacterized lipoprotein YajG